MGLKTDSFIAAHPIAARFAEKRIRAVFATGTGENISVHAAATFACAFLLFGAPFEWVYYLGFAVMLAVWPSAALLAGFMRQWLFPVYSAVLRFLPLLLLGGRNPHTGALDELLTQLCSLVTDCVFVPLYALEPDRTMLCAVFFGIEAALFIAGIFLRKSAKQSRFYCKIRIQMLQHPSK